MKQNKLKNIIAIIILTILCIFTKYILVNAETRNNNPMLKDIKINGYSLEPSFEMFTTEYVITVDENVQKLSIEAIPDDNNASVKIIGDNNLQIGRNKIEIQVTAEDNQTKQSYFLYITKGNPENTNAYLKEITINGVELAPKFNKENINYAFEYPKDLEKLKISAIPEDSNATVEIIGNENLTNPSQNIEVKVTAKDGQTIKTYYFIAKKSDTEVEDPEGRYDIEEVDKVVEEDIIEPESTIQESTIQEQSKTNTKSNYAIYVLVIILVIVLIIICLKIFKNRRKHKHEK